MRGFKGRKRKAGAKPKKSKLLSDSTTPYNIPSEADLAKLRAELDAFLKKLRDDGYNSRYDAESQLVSLCVQGLRLHWMSCPTKLAFQLSRKEPDLDLSTRRKFKFKCDGCGEYFTQTQVDVDHKIPAGGATTWEQLPTFARNLLQVRFDDLQLLCNDNDMSCHPLKTLGEKYGKDIAWAGEYKLAQMKAQEIVTAKDDKRFISSEIGEVPAGRKEDRVKQIINFLMGDSDTYDNKQEG